MRNGEGSSGKPRKRMTTERIKCMSAFDRCPHCGWQLPTSYEVVEYLDDSGYGVYRVKRCLMCQREVLL